jgi:hypothetical protein
MLWVVSYRFAMPARCPLLPQKRPNGCTGIAVAIGRNRTYCRVALTDTDFTEPTIDVW